MLNHSSTANSTTEHDLLTSETQKASPSFLGQMSPPAQIIIGTLCFIVTIETFIYTFIIITKTISSSRMHDTYISPNTRQWRKFGLALAFFVVRLVTALSLVVVVLDW
eukprot:jgi/Hompol1/1601/HPOL_004797-RA